MGVVRGWWPVGVTVALTLGGCSGQWRPAPVPGPVVVPPVSTPGAVQTGIASWYGPGFHGKRTSNGEVYNQYELTAAHRTLPFGTRLRVTDVDTGRSVTVRVNDRGPFVRGRVVDVSASAAETLGITGKGVAKVKVDVVEAGAK